VCGLLCVSPIVLSADGTRTWTQAKYEEFSKGTATNLAIRSNGSLELAMETRQVLATPSTYIWAIAVDEGGNVYAAGGSPARVYRIAPDGNASVIFEAKELQVQAVVVAGGAVYAATSPDGKVYRIDHKTPDAAARNKSTAEAAKPAKAEKDAMPVDPAWAATEVFAPKAKYIWALVADAQGNVYVATGDPGEIHKLTAAGEHSLLFKSDETHIRALALDGKGNVIAGSDGSGLVYRVSPSGEAFVLYSAPKKEITAIAVDANGDIYAAGAGEKRAGPATGTAIPLLPAAGGTSPGIVIQPQAAMPVGGANQVGIPGLGQLFFPGSTGTGSEIYRIAADGTPVRFWSSHDDLAYALAAGSGRILAGTGNRGRILVVNGVDEFADAGKLSSAQITALAWARNGVLYAATSNLGKIFAIGPKSANEGTFESEVFDSKTYSRWGRVEFRGAGNVELFVRAGNVDNPDRNWSPWKKVELEKDAMAQVPVARFAQWKAVLHSGSVSPRVDSVGLNYLPRNVAPIVDEVTVQLGVRYQVQAKTTGSSGSAESSSAALPHFESAPSSTHDRDAIGVKWNAHDDNDDQLVYSLYYRGDGESQWLLLKDNLTDKAYSFDASLLPDGGYTVKVLASDAPSHAPGEALTASKESARFEVDTTPPRIEDLAASLEGSQIRVRFRAADSFSPIGKAECSIDAGEWRYVEPVGQISDSKTELYDFKMPAPSGPEHVIVVRVYDRYENVGAAKTVWKQK